MKNLFVILFLFIFYGCRDFQEYNTNPHYDKPYTLSHCDTIKLQPLIVVCDTTYLFLKDNNYAR